jgi:PAS domain S-box-containing protein
MILKNDIDRKPRVHDSAGTAMAKSREELLLLFRELKERNAALEAEKAALLDSIHTLERSRSRLLDLYDQAPIGYLTLDRDGRIMEMNSAASEMLSRPLGELGVPIFPSVHEEDRDGLALFLRQALQAGREQTAEIRLVSPSGEGRIVQLRCLPTTEQDGSVCCRSSILDISERKRAIELELHLEQEERQALLENSPDMICRFDPLGRWIYANRTFERLTGQRRELIAGTPLGKTPDFDAEVVRGFELAIATVVTTGSQTGFEYRVEYAGEQWFHASAFPQCSPEGEIVSVLIISRDITERRRMEEELRSSMARLQIQASILEQVHDAVVGTDLEGRVTFWNKAAERLFGYSAPEVMGTAILWEDLWRDVDCSTLGESMATRQVVEFEAVLRDKNGREFPGHVSLSMLKDERGTPLGYIGSCMDISELKEAQRRIEHSRDELDRQVRQRTVELERQVAERKRAEEAAVAATRAKSEFLANMSHEIRTPLSGIVGLTQLTLEAAEQHDIRENLELIRYSAETLTQIVNDLLDFSKIEAMQMRIRPAAFDLRERLDLLTGSFAAQSMAKGLAFDVCVDPDVPRVVTTDPHRMVQVLSNLLSNAVKFTAGGQVTLRVFVDHREGKPQIAFTVSDTGIGIPKDKLKDIFLSFIQADSTFTKRYGGTGLGLAISRQLAELMGGSIEVRSVEGQGSTFTFRLPMETLGETATQQAKPAPAGMDRGSQETRPLTILLAEDNLVNQLFLSRFLENAGHSVAVVDNGNQVLSALESRNFDLILMDIQMPGMNGVEATRAIRSAAGSRFDQAIPIIALTAYAMDEDRRRFLDAGMDGYVSKPVDLEQLKRIIAEVASRKG